MADNEGISNFKILLCVVTLIMIITFLILIYISIMNEDSELENISYGLISSSFIIIASMALYETFRDSNNVLFHYFTKAKVAINHHFEMLNIIHKHRGIYWVFNDSISMLECRVATDTISARRSSENMEEYEEHKRQKMIEKINKRIQQSIEKGEDSVEPSP